MATLQDLKIRTLLRLGQITEGSWGKEIYFEGTADEVEVDELKMVLNESQVSVLRDIYTHQFMPYKRLNDRIPIIPGQTIYTLPQEYIQMVSIYHHKDNQRPKRLKPAILTNFRQFYNENAQQVTGAASPRYFEKYEVSGQIGHILAHGTVTWADTQDQFASDNVNLTAVRQGDLVTNATDNSQGVITQFGSGIATIGDGFHGGRSNRIQIGDEFIIHSREESRFALEVWPPIDFEPPELSYEYVSLPFDTTTENALTMSPTADGVIEKVRLQFSKDVFDNILPDYDAQDRLLLYIRNANTGQEVDTLGFQNAMIGWNELDVVDSRLSNTRGYIQLLDSETYEVYLVSADSIQNGLPVDWSLAGNTKIEFIQQSTEFLGINFVKRPAPFIIDESICELADELHECLIEKACLTALRKIDEKLINQSILAHYKIVLNDAKMLLTNLQEPTAHNVFDQEDLGLHNYTPGFTSVFWD